MKYTSAQAAKILRKYEDEKESILSNEELSREFLAAVGEDIESVRPAYNYSETQKKIEELDKKIRHIKHAINVFNSTHTVDGFDMTIDQLLVYLPQLSRQREKLRMMKSCLPKTREAQRYAKNNPIIDYRYTNYEIADAAKDYDRVSDLLARAQTALDTVNNTVEFEIEL